MSAESHNRLEAENELILGFASIETNTKPEILFGMLRQIHELNVKDGLHFEQFNKFVLNRYGLASGTINQEDISKSLKDLQQLPDSSKDPYLAHYYYDLCDVYNLDSHEPIEYWKKCLVVIDDPYKHAKETSKLISSVTENESKEHNLTKDLLDKEAEVVQEILPSYDNFKKLTINQLGSALDFIWYSEQKGIDHTDLKNYFLEALTNIDLAGQDGYVIERLLCFTRDSNLNKETIITRMQMCSTLLEKPERENMSNNAIREGLVSCYLKFDMWDKAVDTWRGMDRVSATSAVSDFVEHAARNKNLSSASNLYTDFQGLHDKDVDPEHIKSNWRLQWYLAANNLSKEGINIFEEPELTEFIENGGADFDLQELSKIPKIFQDRPKIHELVTGRIKEQIKRFNNGKLGFFETKSLLETLLTLNIS